MAPAVSRATARPYTTSWAPVPSLSTPWWRRSRVLRWMMRRILIRRVCLVVVSAPAWVSDWVSELNVLNRKWKWMYRGRHPSHTLSLSLLSLSLSFPPSLSLLPSLSLSLSPFSLSLLSLSLSFLSLLLWRRCLEYLWCRKRFLRGCFRSWCRGSGGDPGSQGSRGVPHLRHRSEWR